jgi:glycosyltransferase involved in cell wall biosynthesis
VPATPRVSVVFAAHNRAERTRALLEALERQSVGAGAFEVIAVDDGSSDDTGAVLEAAAASGPLALTVIRHEVGRGPAAARNSGWRAASGALVAFTDDDCRPDERWLEAGLAAWAGDERRIVQGRTTPDPEEAGRGGPFSRSLSVGGLGPYFQTANIFYPRALLERVGGFDEGAFKALTAEDADLAWRALESGADAVFEPEALVLHAVHELGPLGKLRVAARWGELPFAYRRHEGLRRTLVYRVFWKKSHYHLARAAIGLALPNRPLLRPLKFWCLQPLVPSYLLRARDEGARPWQAPYFVVHDAVELVVVARGALRYRMPML